jgi:hypothetical protein
MQHRWFAKHLAAIWEHGHSVNINDEGEAYVQPHPNGHIIHGYINLQLMQQITYLKPLVLIILGLLMGMMLNNWSSFQCAEKT